MATEATLEPTLRLRIDLVSVAPWQWEARGGALGIGRGKTVIEALADLVQAMRRDAEEWVEEAVRGARAREKPAGKALSVDPDDEE